MPAGCIRGWTPGCASRGAEMAPAERTISRVSLVGYGEVGRTLAEDLRARGVAVRAFDLKLHGEAGEPLREHALLHGVQMASSVPPS